MSLKDIFILTLVTCIFLGLIVGGLIGAIAGFAVAILVRYILLALGFK